MEPYFCYCCSVWGCRGSTEKDCLQKLQNRAARIITSSSFTTSALPLTESLGWKTIEELISNETKVCVFKALNGLAPQYLTELFSRNSQRSLHILQNTSTDLKLPLFKTANGQKCVSFRGVKYWKSLSAIIIIEIEKMWGMNTTTIPVVLGALGLVKKGMEKYISKIPGNISIQEAQKCALLGTAHILRRILSIK